MLYLAADDMRQFQLTETMLFDDLAAGRFGEPLRSLIAELVQRARDALTGGQSYLTALKGRLDGDCAFILQLIIAIYRAVLDKIETCGYNPLARRHRLTDGEEERIVLETAQQVGYSWREMYGMTRKEHDEYEVVPFSRMRRLTVDILGAAHRKHIIHGLLEVDVTRVRQFIREYEGKTGEVKCVL